MHTLQIDRLKLCREKLGITKQEAAKRINVSQPAYLRYESGQRNPSIQVINEMAIAFSTSVEYLTGESDTNLSDTYVINSSKNPDLFDIITVYNNLDESRQRRIQAYVNKQVTKEKRNIIGFAKDKFVYSDDFDEMNDEIGNDFYNDRKDNM